MEDKILQLIQAQNGDIKLSNAEISGIILSILAEMAGHYFSEHSLRVAMSGAYDRYCMDKHVAKFGTPEAVSWQKDASKMGSSSCHALLGQFSRI